MHYSFIIIILEYILYIHMYVFMYICVCVCVCVCVCFIHQSESVAAVAFEIGMIYDTFWIASRRVARAAMVGFAQARKRKNVCEATKR